jgi:hypothetical protein
MKAKMMKQLGVILSLGILMALAASRDARAENTVTIGCYDTTPSAVDLVIPIYLKNDVDLRAVVVPVLIRKIGPAYVDKVKLSDGDRMKGLFPNISFFDHFNQGTSDTCGCKRTVNTQPKSPGGFVGTFTFNDTLKHSVTGIPYGIMFSRNRLLGGEQNLVAGSDKTGSFRITVDVGVGEGCFEIDTTCIDPSNHLLFSNLSSQGVYPAFAQGVIHVGACTGTAMASVSGLTPGNGSEGLKNVLFDWDPVDLARAYEIQIDTVDETFSHIWIHRFVFGDSMRVTIDGDTLIPKNVYWQVRAAPKDCDRCFGPWSSPSQYTDVQTIASSDVPDSYILNQNYPNPFNASTVIQFTNKRDGHVRLEVFNILGQNVVTLVDEFKPLGAYAVTWDGTDSRGSTVPSGMYFYRVSTEDFTAVKKMTLLK